MTFTCSSDCPEESCECAIHENIAEMKSGWKHAVSFSKGLGGRLPLSKLSAGHVLEAAADRMQSIFLSVRTQPRPVPLAHRGGPYWAEHLCSRWLGRDRRSGQEHASTQSAVSSRCAVPLFSFIYISNSQVPGSCPWVNLTVCSVACSASLDTHTAASLSQAKFVCECKILLTSCLWCCCQNCFSLNRLDFTAQWRWRWYVVLHCKHTLSWPLLICTQRKMANVLARCGYYCCGCTAVVSETHLKPHPLSGESMNEWIPRWVDKLRDDLLWPKPQTNTVVHSQVVWCCGIFQVQLLC